MEKQVKITLVGLSFWLLFVTALFGGDSFWGLNFSLFIGIGLRSAIFITSLLLICLVPILSRKIDFPKTTNYSNILYRFAFLAIGFLLLYNLTIYENVYGDSVQFLERMGESTTVYSQKYLSAFLSLDLTNPKLGNLTVLSFVRLLSLYFNITHLAAFQLIGIVSGLLFFNLSFTYISQTITNRLLQISLLSAVLLSPFNQLFLGHAEIYALAFPAVTWYLLTLKSCLAFPSKKKLFLLVVSFVLCVKLHYLFILLFPTLALSIIYLIHPDKVKQFVNWKFLLRFILFPILLIGIGCYFLVFKDYNDPRFLGPEVDLYDRLFLPIFSHEAPLDRYNLFSFNHLFDFFNMAFLWSTVGLFLLVVTTVFYVKKINWNQPIIVVNGFLIILFSMAFFAFNPLLSMPMDFDLFSLAAPFLLFFAFFIVEQLQNDEFAKSISGSVIGISLFSLFIFIGNHHKESLSLRMESVGKHVFKTYWIRSAGDIQSGLNLIKNDSQAYLNRSIAVAQELEIFALKGNDREYANLLWSIGKEYRKQQEYAKALDFHLKSNSYDDTFPANYIGLMESNYLLEDYPSAYDYAKDLIRLNYPSEKRAYEIAIDCALKSNYMTDASKMMSFYLTKWESAYYRSFLSQQSNL